MHRGRSYYRYQYDFSFCAVDLVSIPFQWHTCFGISVSRTSTIHQPSPCLPGLCDFRRSYRPCKQMSSIMSYAATDGMQIRSVFPIQVGRSVVNPMLSLTKAMQVFLARRIHLFNRRWYIFALFLVVCTASLALPITVAIKNLLSDPRCVIVFGLMRYCQGIHLSFS